MSKIREIQAYLHDKEQIKQDLYEDRYYLAYIGFKFALIIAMLVSLFQLKHALDAHGCRMAVSSGLKVIGQ